MAASVGRLTYWLALLMVMGRTALVRPPRMPTTAKVKEVVFYILRDGGEPELTCGLDIEIIHGYNDADTNEYQVPVVQQFRTEYAAQVVIMTELLKHRCRGATTCIFEIDGIGQVDHHRQAVEDHEHPFGHRLPTVSFLKVKRQEHKNGIEQVGVDDAGIVENPTAMNQLGNGQGCEAFGKGTPVLANIHHPAYGIDNIYQDDVEHEGYHTGYHGSFNDQSFHYLNLFLSYNRQAVTQGQYYLLHPIVFCHKIIEMQDALRLKVALAYMFIGNMTTP